MNEQDDDIKLEEIEIELLLEGLYRRYGVDLRDYARASLRRHLRECMQQEQVSTVSGFQEKALHDAECLERLLLQLASNSAAMFHDPKFYLAFRAKVVPQLRTYPFVRIWHAGCATGEEVYSMAILLEEEGLYSRCRIYATDMNEYVLRQARDGIFSLNGKEQNQQNYAMAGGKGEFDDYYTGAYGSGIFRASLK